MKLHVDLDHSGCFPAFATITEGRKHDVPVGRRFAFPKGSLLVIDKGYTDYGWCRDLTDKGVVFVTRERIRLPMSTRTAGKWDCSSRRLNKT